MGMKDEKTLVTFPYAEDVTWAKQQGLTGYMREIEQERTRAEKEGRKPAWLNVNKGHYEHLDRFLDCIEGKGANPCDIESAVAVNLIMLKILDSARSGLPVAVSPEDWNLP